MTDVLPPWNRDAWSRFMARRASDTLPNALLLAGPRGLGKRDFLERVAHLVLCDTPRDDGACGECRGCRLLAAGTHPDRVDVRLELNTRNKPRTDIVVSQIRNLSSRMALSSQFGGWQVATIDPADAMNRAAANALLKTLEEPSSSTMIVLVADQPWRLPATIRSRCQTVSFHVPPRDEALTWLNTVGVDDPATALDAALDNPGMARELAEQGALEDYRHVAAELADLAAGRTAAHVVMRRWLDDDDVARRVRFAAQLAAEEARAESTAGARQLGSNMDVVGLTDWFSRANRVGELLRTPLRQDLMVLELLTAWH